MTRRYITRTAHVSIRNGHRSAVGDRSPIADRSPIPYGRPQVWPRVMSTHSLAELRARGSTGSSCGVGLADGPEPDELADFGSALVPGRRTSRPRGLFVVDGGSQCPEGPFCAAGSTASCWEAGVLLSVEVGPGFPFCSLMFLFVPSRPLSRGLGGGTPRAGNGIPAGQRPAGMVGVTGFEPAASSSRTGDHSSLPCH